jgi:hypothetical protein
MDTHLKTLDEIMVECQSDKASQFTRTYAKPHDYCHHLEKFFAPIRNDPIRLVEAGVGGGESIRGWLLYFPNAFIHGVDIVHSTNPWNSESPNADERYRFSAGDAASADFWSGYKHGIMFDVVIDDASHMSKDVIETFGLLWSHVTPKGLYVIEDLGCSYSAIFQTPGIKSAVEMLKEHIDAIHNASSDIESIYFSKELAILKKS